MSTDDRKPYLSYSQLNLYGNCAEAYRRRYIEGEKIPPGVAAVRGRAVHKAAEINHRQKVETRADLPASDLRDAAATAFDKDAELGVHLSEEERSVGAEKVLGAAKDTAVSLVDVYAQHVAPVIQPVMVEQRVLIETPGPYDLLAILDCTTEEGRIKDLKTSARAKSQADADTSLQLTWYSMAYEHETMEAPTGIDLEVLIATKTPKPQRLSTSRGDADYARLSSRLDAMAGALQAGVFVPANPDHWMCSPRWCGYYATCPYAGGARKVAA